MFYAVDIPNGYGELLREIPGFHYSQVCFPYPTHRGKGCGEWNLDLIIYKVRILSMVQENAGS